MILFEEMLEPGVLDASVRLAEDADLVLAVGTTLTVHPVAGLVPYAFGHSARVVIVNAQETPYDYLANAVLRDPIEDVLPRLVDAAGEMPEGDAVWRTTRRLHGALAGPAA